MKSICSVLVLFCLVCSLFFRDSYAESAPVDEYKIKVGYLFNFTKFITWSEEANDSFNICILGNDPFGEIIDPIEQRTAFNLPIKLFRLTAMDKAVHCHIVYVGSNVSTKTIAESTKNSLTVGEEPEFISQGGMIAFVKRQDKIKLQINLKLLQQNGLKISAKLLEVVEIVGGDRND